MRLVLIHNPTAGSEGHSGDGLVAAFRRAGHAVKYRQKEDWKEPSGEITDAVVVAGGDGTVREVAITMAGRGIGEEIPLAILPLGTANNIAQALGVRAGLDELAAGLSRARATSLGVGIVDAPWGTAHFVESVGVGAFASMLHQEEDARKPKKWRARWPHRSRKSGSVSPIEVGLVHLRSVLREMLPVRLKIEADGRDLAGKYLMAEAMNIPSIGPCVDLAPGTDPGDEWLDVVLVRETDRGALDGYLEGQACHERHTPPVPPIRVRRVRMSWPEQMGHLDDEPWPARSKGSATDEPAVSISIERRVPVLVVE